MALQKSKIVFFSLLSFLMIGFAQPDWSTFACLLASTIGYALFWYGMMQLTTKKGRFFLATLWFAAIQAVHLNWFMNDRYVGFYIYFFLAILYLFLGVQFGLISLFLPPRVKQITLVHILGISGLWALFEWGRLFLLSGFSWNPAGLALTGTLVGMQLISAVGVFGLTFWVSLTNLFALKLMGQLSMGNVTAWSMLVLTPYLYGGLQITLNQKAMNQDTNPPLRTLLVQTSLYPEQKMPLDGIDHALSPDMQWERILSLIYPYHHRPVDLVVLSESAVPFGADIPIYPIELVRYVFNLFEDNLHFFPKSEEPKVGNRYWAQALANTFDSDVVIGLDDLDRETENAYNAAFLFHPYSHLSQRYEKRVLVPLGEYIPFAWCRPFLRKYGIIDSFTPGREAKVFPSRRTPLSMSICYEETYGHLMREGRLNGAGLLINLTNDVWYPRSRLPYVHFLHGRLRAVENGIPMLRACNTGVTCGIDSLGRIVGMLDYETARRESPAEAIYLALPLFTYQTFYTRFGDWPIVTLSSFSFCLMSLFGIARRRLFGLNNLKT